MKPIPHTLLAGSALAALFFSLPSLFAQREGVPTWIDPEKAAEEHPDFLLQGEYLGQDESGPFGLQAAAIDEGQFHVLVYRGGLPGEGWDGKRIETALLEREALEARVASLDRIDRESPSLGAEAPEGAIVLFDGEATEHIEGRVEDGLLWAGAKTLTPASDFHLHLEYRLPYKPARALGNQDRGNSGVYLFNNYEVQILDSFGLDFDAENNAVKPASDAAQWNASFYKFKTPDVPMSLPPLAWQTYEIDFRAPRFDAAGEKIENARISVTHNGVLVHDDVELPEGTGGGASRPERPEGLVFLQDHGNPVAFRNLWLLAK